MRTQRDIVDYVKDYREVMLDHAKQARYEYYREERKFYRNLRFDEFLEYRSKLHLLEDILGIPDTKIEIVIYA